MTVKIKFLKGLTSDTYLLALSSLFADISTEMLYPVLPIYLTQILKVNGSAIGIIEGVATATQNIVQGFSGWLSDKLQNRKFVALIGFSVAAISKPLIGLSATWQEILGARFLDRLGTGTRSAPRDALLAGSVDSKIRGKAFGLEGFGDNLGAFLGPIISIFLIFILAVSLKSIFLLAFIPAAFAALMVVFVSDKKSEEPGRRENLNIKNLPSSYWKYLTSTALFGVGNSTSAFLILTIKGMGASLLLTISVYALVNLVAALSSYPAGTISDKVERKNVLLLGFTIFIIVYLGFALSQNLILIGVLFLLYGVYQGIFRSVGKSLATDFIPSGLRASAIGWYSATVGLSGLIASIVAGFLWDVYGHPAVFLYGASFAIIGSLTLLLFVPKNS